MGQTLNQGQKLPYVVNEVDANGNNVTPATTDSCTVSSGDTSKATIVPDTVVAPGALASGFIMAGTTTGDVTISASATTGAGSFSASETITINPIGPPPPPPTNVTGIKFTFGTAVSQ